MATRTKKTPARIGRELDQHLKDPLPVVRQAVRDMPDAGRFGWHKVFISAIWDKVRSRIGMSLPQFQDWLVIRNLTGDLTLARADLVGAMDPQLVRDSEISSARGTFHFVVDREARDPWDEPAPPIKKPPAKIEQEIRQYLEDPLLIVIDELPKIHGRERFGDRKVFISALWTRVRERVRMSLPEFKNWLIEQHLKARLVLSRADLVAAMPHDLVSSSHTRHDNIVDFHFVNDPSVVKRG